MTHPHESLEPLHWCLDPLLDTARITDDNDAGRAAKRTRYPFRYLRYWFMDRMLMFHARRIGRPLRVLEVGIHRGQLRSFLRSPFLRTEPAHIASWDGLDIDVSHPVLRDLSYRHLIEHDLEEDRLPPLPHAYDAVVTLHVLEHVTEPGRVLQRFAEVVPTGGCIIGGSPTMPTRLAAWRERRLRRRNKPGQHVSVVTPGRLHEWSTRAGLRLDLATGSFLTRNSGGRLENSRAWVKFNLLWGRLIPSLGSELYFSLQKPASA